MYIFRYIQYNSFSQCYVWYTCVYNNVWCCLVRYIFSYFSLNIMFLTYFHVAGFASSTLLLTYMVYPCIRGWRPRLHSPPATVDIFDILPYGTVGDFCLWGVYWQVRLQIYSHYGVRFFFTKATLEGYTSYILYDVWSYIHQIVCKSQCFFSPGPQRHWVFSSFLIFTNLWIQRGSIII